MKSSGTIFIFVSTLVVLGLLLPAALLLAGSGDDAVLSGSAPPMVRGDYTPTNEWVEIVHAVNYQSGTTLSVSSSYDVREITIDNVTFTADMLRTMADNNPDSPVVSSLKNEIESYTTNTFGTFTSNGKVGKPVMGIEDEDLALSYVDSDEYSPPITVTSTTTVTLGKLDFFTTQEDAYYDVADLQDLIHGCLLMGGKIYSDVIYYSYMGHNTTYKIGSSFPMLGKSDAKYTTEVGVSMTSDVVSQPEVSLQDSGNPMTVTINNAKNTKNIAASARMSFKNAESYAYNTEKWNTTAALDLEDFDKISIADSPVYVHSIKFENIDTGFPENIRDIQYASADGIRLLYENDIMHVDQIKDYIEESVDGFEKELKKSLDTTDDPGITLEWEWSTITGRSPKYYLKDPPSGNKVMGDERPVVCVVKSKNTMKPNMYSDELNPFALKGFLNGGAKYSFDLNLGLSPNIAADLKLPAYIRLYNEKPSATSGDRATFHFEPMYSGKVTVESTLAPKIDSYKANGYITADINNVKIESTSEVSLDVDINLDGEFFQISSRNTFIKDYLPEGVDMAYITSDVVRLSIQEGYIDEDELMTRMTNIIKENLTEFVEGDLTLVPTLDKTTTVFDGNIYQMDGSSAIEFNIHGTTTYTYGARSSGPGQLQSAFEITSQTITLKLRGLESWDVSWKVILPADLEVKSTRIAWTEDDAKVSDLTTGVDGGRDYFQLVLYDDGKADVDVDISVTAGFIAGQFCVVFIIILIVLILLVVLIIALVVRSKKKKKDEEDRRRGGRDDDDMYDDRGRGGRGGSGRGGGGRGGYDDDYDRGGRGRDRGYDDYDRPRRGRGGGRGGPMMLMVLLLALLF